MQPLAILPSSFPWCQYWAFRHQLSSFQAAPEFGPLTGFNWKMGLETERFLLRLLRPGISRSATFPSLVSLCCIVCLQILRSLKRVKGVVEAQTILQLESCTCLQNAYQYVFSHTTSGTWNIKASLFSSCPTKRHKRRKSQILEHFSHKAHSLSPASSVPAVTRYNWQQRKSVWSDQNTKRKSQLAQRGPLPRPLLLVRASWPFPAQSNLHTSNKINKWVFSPGRPCLLLAFKKFGPEIDLNTETSTSVPSMCTAGQRSKTQVMRSCEFVWKWGISPVSPSCGHFIRKKMINYRFGLPSLQK